MRVYFDQETDALYIRLDEAPVRDSEEVSPEIVLDFDAENRVIGIEALDVKRRLPGAQLQQIHFEVA